MPPASYSSRPVGGRSGARDAAAEDAAASSAAAINGGAGTAGVSIVAGRRPEKRSQS